MTTSPLGRLGPLVASLVVLGVIGTALAVHIAVAFGLAPASIDTGWTDQAAFALLGFIFGAVLGPSAASAASAAGRAES